MEQSRPSAPDDPPAGTWLRTNATTVFAALRRVVPDSLCAYDLGLELSALVAHRWDTFDPDRDRTRMAWSIRLAADLVADACARDEVPVGERHRNEAPQVVTLSAADLHRLSQIARAPLDLDKDAADALAALERSAPSPGALSRLRTSELVRRSGSDVRQDT